MSINEFRVNYVVQSNLCTMTTLGPGKSGRCLEVVVSTSLTVLILSCPKIGKQLELGSGYFIFTKIGKQLELESRSK